jgi:dTDP-4-dehydrorhamnose reductase
MHTVILGYKGTLGQQLALRLPGAVCWDREDVDVLDFPALERKMEALTPRPASIINCIAFNDVDGAEADPDAAYALNGDFPGRLAELTRRMGAICVHYSTNYVFDGVKGEYEEADPPSPVSVYARSKHRGEQLVAANADRYYLIRTAVIFGPKGSSEVSKKSFVDIMLDLSTKTGTISAVNDEVNSITYAPDLAEGTCHLLHSNAPSGIYHLTNAGAASWYDLAQEIFRLTGRTIDLIPVPATTFPRKAQRPARSVLHNTKTRSLRPWQDALRDFLLA